MDSVFSNATNGIKQQKEFETFRNSKYLKSPFNKGLFKYFGVTQLLLS
jgi:hypothetical protein